MNATLQKSQPLRKCWDQYLSKTKMTQREVAEKAGVDPASLSRAITAGVASEALRLSLANAGVPQDLLPLPTNPAVLAGIIRDQMDKISRLQHRA